VLRREAVVDGDDDGGDSPAEPPADGVVGKRIRREEREAAAVEENNDGEAAAGGGCGVKDSEPEVPFGVDGDVLGGNTVNGFGVRLGFAIEEVHETAVNGAVRTACIVR